MTIVVGPSQPPLHLTPSSREWWTSVIRDYELEEHHLRLLQLACEAWDRAQTARARLDAEGLMVLGKDGPRPHPCVAIERDARLGFARMLRELDLDVSPPASERTAPPPLLSNNRGRRAGKVARS